MNVMTEKITFSFGKNWEEFIINNFTEERVKIAEDCLLDFLKLNSLQGVYFLDVGCGSGLHSLAAWKAGVKKIVSFDIDPYSAETTKKIREMQGSPPNWEVFHGSILDKKFIANLELADLVYSWGVLHHTGKMWESLENTIGLVKHGGFLCIALYTTDGKSDYWLKVKEKYNRVSEIEKRLMEFQYLIRHTFIPHIIDLKNPFRTVREYKKNRGMSYLVDVRDWLGGYPYEHAKIEDVLQFCMKRFNLEFISIKTGEANTEYLFKKRS